MPALTNEFLENLLKEQFGDKILKSEVIQNQLQMEINGKDILEIVTFVKNDERCQFDYLVDIGGVDYLKIPERPERFGVIYVLQNMTSYFRFVIRAYVSEENPEISSLTGLYEAANWAEREVYDMYGVEFKNHPDLRRILMPDYYEYHPLRKDYPLKGRGERENFPRYENYEPSKVK